MRVWMLGLLLCGVAGASGWKAMLAPGPVSAGHAEHGGNCDACHSAFDGIPDERCLSCHEGVAGRISSGEGWHASVSDTPCIGCHTDHRGEAHSGTRDEAMADFDHGATGFPLSGGHAVKDCEKCHTGTLDEMEVGCASCHTPDDPHDSALGPACGTCHQPSAWPAGLKTLGDHGVAMDGGHDGLQCADCHTHGEHLATTTTCNSCHEEGHGGTESPCSDCHQPLGWKPAEFDHGPCTCAFPGRHQTVECLDCHEDFTFVDTPTACGGCHDPGDAHQPLGECATCHNALSWSDSQFDHNKQSSFALDGAHQSVSCDMCHTTAGKFRGAPTACEGCHTEPSHPDFGACATCHEATDFAESTFDHATTGFSLSGKHGTLPCASCHAPGTEAKKAASGE